MGDEDRLADTRLFAFHARRLGISALPYATLIDGLDQISLMPPLDELTGEDSGCLVPGVAAEEDHTVVDYANPPEEDEPEEEEPPAQPEPEEEGDPVDEDLDEGDADDVVAGVISGEDLYEGEPEGDGEDEP